ncbi:DUF2070 family protein [Candidatus Nanohaloarchaea archaeon]|nr:DUF2070 family protein [Candidatus Nanohaloarchaea archaeon]
MKKMGMDNVESFEWIIFRIPEVRTSLIAMTFLSFLYSSLMYLGFSKFTAIPIEPSMVFYLAVMLFILPALVAGEIYTLVLPDYPRHWGYFLVAANQFFTFVFGMILTGANSSVNAWRIVWLGLITLFLVNTLVLTLTLGSKHLKKIVLVSLIQPLIVLLVGNHYLSPFLQFRWWDYASNLGVLLFTGLVLGLLLHVIQYLVGSNVSNVSAFNLTSGLLQKKQQALDLGYPANPEVHTLQIENEEGKATIGVPWVHPGPLGAFGGGELSTTVIEKLNQGVGNGFFMHVPSNHEADMADPDDAEKILDEVERPEMYDEASKMIKKDYSLGTLYGRRFDGKNLVFMQIPDYDDYEMSVVRDCVDLDSTLVVDLHNHIDEETSQVVWSDTAKAEELRRMLKDFVSELEDQEVSEYNAGFDTDLTGDIPVFTWVEEVDGQRTLVYGIEGNGSTERLQELHESINEDFDEAVFFTTDTHASIHEMAKGSRVDENRLRESIARAKETLGEAGIGLGTGKAEGVKLLQSDYQGLIYSINIMIRLLPLALISMYVLMVLWLI